MKLKDRDKVHLEALYDSEISYHDVHFRAILTALEKRQLADDTMIVVVADHGEEFWDHGSVGHGHSVYEELLRIPMVIRVPGLTQTAATIRTSAGLVDVMPTVLEALGQAIPAELSGRSLLKELSGAARGCSSGHRVGVHGRLAHRGRRWPEVDSTHRATRDGPRPGERSARANGRRRSAAHHHALSARAAGARARQERARSGAGERQESAPRARRRKSTPRRRRSCAP